MKKNKGFTLIEVLAAVVVLVLILAIITPKIFKQFTHAGKVTDQEQINALLNASKIYVNQNLNLFMDEDEDEYIILINELKQAGLINSETILLPSTHEELQGCVVVTRKNNKFNYNYEESDKCDKQTGTVKFKQVKDKNPGVICGEGETEDYDNSDTCYIYSVEDLVEFSNLVNSGKNFSGKTIMLMENLDIQNDKSYLNAKINLFGDVNENGTISATLKEELTDTEAKGFKPIGNNTNKFTGTFEGNAKTIKNLFINRSSESYVGLFGYTQATIRGLNVINAEITGSSNVGIIAGYSTGNLTNLIARGNVSGYRLLGLGSGQVEGGKIEAVVSGNVSSTYTAADIYGDVGGIAGWAQYGTKIRGIMQSGTISISGSSSQAYRIVGNMASATVYALASDTVVAPSSDNSITSKGGATINSAYVNEIASLEQVLDTYIGGDKDWDSYSDGYYYDQNDKGEVIIKKTTEYPITITMSGSGTADDPYIINNYNDLKQVNYNLSARYKLNADIDFQNKVSIMLGSEQNKFTGVFDGNAHTINNLQLGGYDSVGLFGYNTGTIRGLNVINAEITGSSKVGIIAGYSTGNLTSLIARGNISGYRLLGLAAGQVENGKVEAVVSGNVSSTYTAADIYGDVGGIAGWAQYGTKIRGIMQSGTISISGSSSQAYRIVGNMASATVYALASDTVVAPSSDNSITSKGGVTIAATNINNIAALETVLDTYIGGDKDWDNYSDGYYYDQNDAGEVIIKSITDSPLAITMSGSGTSSDPYIITNYNQLKETAYDVTKYYKLNTDIDFQNKNEIMLGSELNKFTGVFDGNAHTINDLHLVGYNYVGLFGYSNGTIRGLSVINANMVGNEKVGIIVGYSTGNITSLIARGNVSGYQSLGLVVGQTSGGKVEAVASGNVTSTYTGTSSVSLGGMVGWLGSAKLRGIIQSGTITSAGGTAPGYRAVGGKFNTTITALASSTVSAPTEETGIDKFGGATIDSTDINNIAALEAVVDTYIGGDKDWDSYSDGYYYDQNETGEVIIKSITDSPLTITMTGSGTTESPYIINNYNDLKQAAYNPSAQYKLNADINFQNKNEIMLGSEQNRFTGVFDGNAHTINNLHLVGYNKVGLFGYNRGTIKGLNVINANIVGNEQVGIMSGYSTGNITNIIARGNVSGYRIIGLIVGETSGGTINAVVSGNVTSSYTSSGEYGDVGGMVGWLGSATLKGIIQSGTISIAGSGNAYKVVGNGWNKTISAAASETVVAPSSDEGIDKYGGKTVTAAQLQTLTPYQEVGLNTSLSSGEYRYALDSNYNPYLIKNTNS